jgi:hypothetical protein
MLRRSCNSPFLSHLTRRSLPPLLAVWLWLAVAGPAGVAHAQPAGGANRETPTWFAQVLARGSAGINVTYLWSLGAKFRAETVVAGHKIITIVSGNTYYAFDGLGMVGVAIQRAPAAIAADAGEERPFGNEVKKLIAQGAEKVREEELMGTMCNVYQITDKVGRRVLWASQDEFELPVRVEIYDRGRGTTKFTDFIDWSRGIPITDAFFVPDPAVKFERYDQAEYLRLTTQKGPVGPVPVLYADLLHGTKAATQKPAR